VEKYVTQSEAVGEGVTVGLHFSFSFLSSHPILYGRRNECLLMKLATTKNSSGNNSLKRAQMFPYRI
jgi:hypothetical protein